MATRHLRQTRGLQAGAVLLITLCQLSGPTAMAGAPQPAAAPKAEETATERLLVGLYLNGRNGDELEVLRSGDSFWLPLDATARLLGLQISEKGRRLTSPLGSVTPPPGAYRQIDGVRYLAAQALEAQLRIRSRFNRSAYALLLDVPWDPRAARAASGRTTASGQLVPTARPPGGSLSFLRLRNFTSGTLDAADDELQLDSTADAGGRFADGTWLVGLRDRDGSGTSAERYFWNWDGEHASGRLGTGLANLNPLLPTLDFVGLQGAYSTRGIRPYRDFPGDVNLDSFLAEDISFQRDIIRRDGPPGGIAELRLNGRPVARVRIDLQGLYEFRNIPYGRSDFRDIELYLYERSIREPPVAIIDQGRQTTRELTAAGETLLRAALGQAGNPLEPRGTGDEVGFLLARHGLSDRLTLQGIVQRDEEGETTAIAGVRSSLGRYWAVSVDLAKRGQARGTFAELLRNEPGWELRLRSRQLERGYGIGTANEQPLRDSLLRSFHQVGDTLRLGAIGRDFDNGATRERFLLPAAYWNPRPSLQFSALPNFEGDYRLQATRQQSYRHRTTFISEGGNYSLVHDYNTSLWRNLQFGADYRDRDSEAVIFSQLSWQPGESVNQFVQAGVSLGRDGLGARVSWRRRWFPGVEAELSWDRQFRARSVGAALDPGHRFLLTVRLDFATVGKRLQPADNQRINFSRGALAGNVVTTDGRRLPVDDMALRVNGRRGPQWQAGGGFYLGGLAPGVYTVEVDEAGLPFEYQLTGGPVVAEVAAAAVTVLDFTVEARFGVAGRILDRESGEALPGLTIEALDGAGVVIARGVSDRFGYYRLDGLAPAEYQLRLKDKDGKRTTRPLFIEDEHRYGVDILR